jgi:hypothetical protein
MGACSSDMDEGRPNNPGTQTTRAPHLSSLLLLSSLFVGSTPTIAKPEISTIVEK